MAEFYEKLLGKLTISRVYVNHNIVDADPVVTVEQQLKLYKPFSYHDIK